MTTDTTTTFKDSTTGEVIIITATTMPFQFTLRQDIYLMTRVEPAGFKQKLYEIVDIETMVITPYDGIKQTISCYLK